MEIPLPNLELMRRAGHSAQLPDDRVATEYLRLGTRLHSLVLDSVPDDWFSAPRRILDFGAGAGRVARHFEREVEAGAELWGCDIHQPAVAWAQENLPHATFFQNDQHPPLELPDEHFDLVYSMSVFTHITSSWADWLRDLHRILRPGGLLIASFLGERTYEAFTGQSSEDASIGMLTLNPDAPWVAGGPTVFHSERWLRSNWSPAFDLIRIEDPGTVNGEAMAQGVVVGRRTAQLGSFPQG